MARPFLHEGGRRRREHEASSWRRTAPRHAVFGEGGGAALAEEVGVPLVASIPLEPAVSSGGDAGADRSCSTTPDSPAGQAFTDLAGAPRRPSFLPPIEMAGCTARPSSTSSPPSRLEGWREPTVHSNAMTMEDIEAIKQVKARYMRCVDTKDWDGFPQTSSPTTWCGTRREGALRSSPVVTPGARLRGEEPRERGVRCTKGGMPEIALHLGDDRLREVVVRRRDPPGPDGRNAPRLGRCTKRPTRRWTATGASRRW